MARDDASHPSSILNHFVKLVARKKVIKPEESKKFEFYDQSHYKFTI